MRTCTQRFLSGAALAALVLDLSAFAAADEPDAADKPSATQSQADPAAATSSDDMRELQLEAITKKRADWGYWGARPEVYGGYASHSNRLIPVYTFGLDLNSVRGDHSVYRNEARIKELYGYDPVGTVNPNAEYFDQTDLFRLQQQAVDAGKKRIILFVYDGMDWQTTWTAATYAAGEVKYRDGRGTGLHMQDYRGVPTDFGYMVTSPHNDGTRVDIDHQRVLQSGRVRGGFDIAEACDTPWGESKDPLYLIAKSQQVPQAVTDSASSASSMTAGIKTYNDAINVDPEGKPVETIARQLQKKQWAIGAVSSVPVSHATPACAYANNVWRDDYQDLTRDLVGLPSVANKTPLPGLDVAIGTGWGENLTRDTGQGENFVPGNRYITDIDKRAIDVRSGGKYVVAERTAGMSGKQVLLDGAKEAIEKNHRLFGYFGSGPRYHLPFRTADGNYDPTRGVKNAEQYTEADLLENPRLSDLAIAALDVLAQNKNGFWLMVEAGDVDWANHDNNIDSSIGAVLDGDAAVKAITDWIERSGGWQDTVLIATADHGHYFHLTKPEVIAAAGAKARAAKTQPTAQ